ncbi:MAG TPA: membrane-bound lytic murein transglycosylase MltF [Rhodocyclaceae bacterium]|nr:membrane-bound lytic murein transglycosylase MltF [Rhodocyclaceae bacterium]
MLLRPAHLMALFLTIGIAACGRLETPEQSGELIVAIRTGPSSYEQSNGEISGFEYDMVEAFAEQMHWKVRYVTAGDQDELHQLVLNHKAHFAASCFATNDERFIPTNSLRDAQPILVGAAGSGRDDGDDLQPADLSGKSVLVMKASPQVASLEKLAGTPPGFKIETKTDVGEFDLLQDVVDGRADYAATDDLQYNLALHFQPDLEVVMDLPGTLHIGWCFAAQDKALEERANDFIKTAAQNGLLARLKDRYFGHITRVKPTGLADFFNLMRAALPHLRKDFQDAQAKTGIDWRLLAAVAYQESQWDPLATSPTGVRGMMMLTEDTADHLGVSNRLDPRQSILAGARYLSDLRDQLPDEVSEPDRTWLALAAYNLGMGHLNGGRAIAASLKRDPSSWYDMKRVLPLLARPQFYSRLKSGKARGGEAVIMVENIRAYYGILSHFEQPWQPMKTNRKHGIGLNFTFQ